MTKQEFIKLVDETHNRTGINECLIEKDFYITNILRELAKREPNVIFKGGTSLSKAYKVINRFSEDVDITLKKELASQSKIREFNKIIEDVCYNKLGLTCKKNLQELHPIRHKGMSNIYYLDYNSHYDNNIIKPYIELDSSFITKVDTVQKMKVSSIIQETLNIKNEPNLEPFEIYVQPIEMIIADKFFAICKNFKRGNVHRYSRHFYDIYCAYNKIIKGKSENNLKKYIEEVAEAEKEKYQDKENVENEPLNKLLIKCCKSDDYKNDYNTDLIKYVYKGKENLPTYEECVKSITELVNIGMFDGLNHYFIRKQKNDNNEQKVYIYEFTNAAINDIKNLTQQEFQGKYCKNKPDMAEQKINELKELLYKNGKMYNDTKYYMLPVEEGSNIYFIIGQNIRRTIALEIAKKELGLN